jgi:phage shock protein E
MNKICMTGLLLAMSGAAAFAAEPAAAPGPAPAAAAAPAEAASVPRISQADLLAHLAKQDSGLVVLDVRTPEEFAAGHVPGARNVSHDQIATRLAELSALKDKQVVLYCRSGRRSALAGDTLQRAGFDKLLHLEGDWQAWEAAQLPVERETALKQ